MLFGTFIRILTSLLRDFCTSDRNFASTFFQIPPHDGHPWYWLVVGHCDYNPHNRLSLSRYMPCLAYKEWDCISNPSLFICCSSPIFAINRFGVYTAPKILGEQIHLTPSKFIARHKQVILFY